jgi:hypothetical protein
MNPNGPQSWHPVGFRILFSGVAVCALFIGGRVSAGADEHAVQHAGAPHPMRSEPIAGRTRSPTAFQPHVDSAAGFHPDFSRIALRESPGNSFPSHINRQSQRQAAFDTGLNRATGTAARQPNMKLNGQYAALFAEKSKEKPKEREPKHEPKSEPKHEPKPEPKHEPKPEPKHESPPVSEPPKHIEKPRHNDEEGKSGKSDSNGNGSERGPGKTESRKPGKVKSRDGRGEATAPGEPQIRTRNADGRQTPSSNDDRPGAEKTGKIKIRQPRDKNAEGVPRLDREKTDREKIDREKPDAGAKGRGTRIEDGQAMSREHLLQTKRDVDLHLTKLQDRKPGERIKLNTTPEQKRANAVRLERLPREQFKLAVAKNGKVDPALAERLKLRPAREVFHERLQNGDFNRYSHLKSGHAYHMQRQFALHQTGDISRRMNLGPALQARGGWRHRHFGPISPYYALHSHGMWYSGPGVCGAYLWYPRWRPWVDWCWWDRCSPIYDTRPRICRPIYYSPCSPWVAWQYPVWRPLPIVSCGTWVDVDPVVLNNGVDLQLLATRFVDPGHPEQQLGPRFRVWFRNNSPFAINQPFNVLLIASTDANAYAGLPEAGVRISGMAAGETQSVDIRLPFAANVMGRDSQNHAVPFSYLNVLVDSHNELSEVFEDNNGATLVRGDILPVDPVIFAADPAHIEPNGVMHLAAEGIGPEPGKVVIVIGDQEFEAEILGWFDLGVQIRIPDFELNSPTAADLVIVRGDGATSQPLTIEIDPGKTDSAYEDQAPAPEVPELPPPPPLPE